MCLIVAVQVTNILCYLGARMGITVTQCWVLENTVAPVRAQVTQAVDIQMQIPATCNIPPTISSATASLDTQVSFIS